MSAFVVGIPVPEGLDPKTYRVRVVVDRIDGAALTAEDLARIDAVYPSRAARRPGVAGKAKAGRKARRAA